MKEKRIKKELKLTEIVIFLIIFSIGSWLVIDNVSYEKPTTNINTNLLSYNNGNYIEKYDVEFYRINASIEMNTTNIKSCTFSIDNKETTITSEGGQCEYSFNDLKEGTIYKIKIIVTDENNKTLYTIEKEIKTLSNLTNHVMNLKDEPLVENHVYYHDSSLKLGAKDESYRYSGKNVNNWVCLSETNEDCKGDNLYRIIGVFKGKDDKYHIKLISADYINEDKLGSGGNRFDSKFEFKPNGNYLGNKDEIHTYYWFNKESNLTGEWEDSLLNKTNLNEDFFNSLGAWKVITFPSIWEIIDGGNDINKTAQEIYNNEMYNKSDKTYEDEIGLMYANDYMYAANPKHWETKGSEYNKETENWLYLGGNEWTISKGLDQKKVIYINEKGNLSYSTDNASVVYAVRPSFYLDYNVAFREGNGSEESPYKIFSKLGAIVHEIKYIHFPIDMTYAPKEAIEGQTLKIEFKDEINKDRIKIYINGKEKEHSFEKNILTIEDIDGNITIEYLNDTLDKSGANPPEMLPNMIPVYYEQKSTTDGVWKVADITNRDQSHKWYDYNDFMWANAVTVKESNGTLNDDGSMTFDGTKDKYYRLGLDNYDFKTDISLVARVKMNKENAFQSILGNQEGGGAVFEINANNKFQFSVYLEETDRYETFLTEDAYKINEWYTLVGTYDHEYVRFYINGKEVAKSGRIVGTIKKSKAEFILGGNPAFSNGNTYSEGSCANAIISDAFIYDDILTADEVSKYFKGEITDYPKDNLLVAKTEFNELDTRQKYLEASAGTEVKMDDISSMWVWIPRYKYTIFNGNNETANEQMINVEFEHGIESTGTVSCRDDILTDDNSDHSEICTDTTNKNIINGKSTYTHPAFTFGDEELVGFWMSKFDMSTDDSTCLGNQSVANCDKLGFNVLIKPDQISLRYQGIDKLFTNIRNMETYKNIHGFPQSSKTIKVTNNNFTGEIPNDNNNYDTHMIKNMEWGAVAYLMMSKYGKYGNNLYTGVNKEVYQNNYQVIANDIYIIKTGYSAGVPTASLASSDILYNNMTTANAGQGYKGAGASTTGTVYGVYDMSGGSIDFVMANMVDLSGNFDKLSWSNAIPLSKYYDKYSFNITNNTESSLKRGKLGDATREVQKTWDKRWYNDGSLLFFDDKNGLKGVWIGRSSSSWSTGIFFSGQVAGGGYYSIGSRPVLTISRDFPWKD